MVKCLLSSFLHTINLRVQFGELYWLVNFHINSLNRQPLTSLESDQDHFISDQDQFNILAVYENKTWFKKTSFTFDVAAHDRGLQFFICSQPMTRSSVITLFQMMLSHCTFGISIIGVVDAIVIMCQLLLIIIFNKGLPEYCDGNSMFMTPKS